MPRTTANLLLLLAGLAWGGGFIAQSTAMDSIGP
ncbi:MAG: EamA/RhaT family transporter, partial [Pseudomonadota bacterium]